MYQVFLLVIAGLSGITFPAIANEPALVVDDGTFAEKYDPSVNVSGQIRAGVMYGSTEKQVRLDSLYVHVPSGKVAKNEKICFRLASRDGVYSAKWIGTANNDLEGNLPARVIFYTEIESRLPEYSPNQLVGVATLGSSCKSDDRIFLPLSWGKNANTKTLEFYLNADATSSSLRVKFENGETDSVECAEISSAEKSLAFDTSCTLKWTESQPAIVVIQRSNFSKPMKKIRFDLVKK